MSHVHLLCFTPLTNPLSNLLPYASRRTIMRANGIGSFQVNLRTVLGSR